MLIEAMFLVPGDVLDLEDDPHLTKPFLRALARLETEDLTHETALTVERVEQDPDASIAVLFEHNPFFVVFPPGHAMRLVKPSPHPDQIGFRFDEKPCVAPRLRASIFERIKPLRGPALRELAHVYGIACEGMTDAAVRERLRATILGE